MNRLIHVGFGNIVNTDKIIAIVSPESAPIKRLVQKAKETGLAIDATQGRRTKSVLVVPLGKLTRLLSVSSVRQEAFQTLPSRMGITTRFAPQLTRRLSMVSRRRKSF